MPITAKLSNKFYEKLGDGVANELVEWLNLVDTSYRQEFKDLFEANFGRIEARLAGMEGVMNARLGGLEVRMLELQVRLLAEMDAKLGRQKWSLLTWTIVFWLSTLGTMVAMLKL